MDEEDFSASAARKRIDRAALTEDHYAIMGLENLRHAASESEIKKAYRKLVLLHHPDKTANEGEDTEDTFRSIQKAYDILMDADKRREYDSMDAPMEETYPSESEMSKASDAEFFKMAGDVFRRIARWSKSDDVPVIGDDSTPVAEAKSFYAWWLQSYESWRTWKHEDEYDVEAAENRDERRWMERQNEKLMREFKRKEKTQLTEFVNLAQKYDPRIRRWKEEQAKKKEEKKQKQAERIEQAKRLEEEARQAEEAKKADEERRVMAEKDAAKKMREKEKRRRKEAHKAFRTACYDFMGGEADDKICTQEHTEILVNDASVEQIRDLTAIIREKGRAAIHGEYKKLLDTILAKRNHSSSPAAKKEEPSQKAGLPDSTEWTLDELAFLAKATNKFPGGYKDRWELIMADLDHHGIRKSLLDVQNQAMQLKRGKKASNVINTAQVNQDILAKVQKNQLTADAPSYNINAISGDPNVWTPAQMKQLQEGLAAVPKDAKERFKLIAKEFVPGKSEEQCYEKFNLLVAEAKAKKKAAAAGGADEWTLEQQKQLEHGLKSVSSKDPKRWELIAEHVDGKSKKQCVARYKELVQRMKEKK